MRTLLAALLCSVISAPAAAQGWTERGIAGVRTDSAMHPWPPIIWFNTVTPEGAPSDQWNVVDVTQWGVPADAAAVFLSGVMIITHGTTPATCDLTISFRAYGASYPPDGTWYIHQAIEPWVGGGERQTMATFVPVNEGKFEYYWRRNTTAQYPAGCGYAINLRAQAYLR
jgi:hypothetical protein